VKPLGRKGQSKPCRGFKENREWGLWGKLVGGPIYKNKGEGGGEKTERQLNAKVGSRTNRIKKNWHRVTSTGGGQYAGRGGGDSLNVNGQKKKIGTKKGTPDPDTWEGKSFPAKQGRTSGERKRRRDHSYQLKGGDRRGG